ncbi:MAG: hypothetical protein ACK6AT_16830, partial [Planctomycetota bacterium]
GLLTKNKPVPKTKRMLPESTAPRHHFPKKEFLSRKWSVYFPTAEIFCARGDALIAQCLSPAGEETEMLAIAIR